MRLIMVSCLLIIVSLTSIMADCVISGIVTDSAGKNIDSVRIRAVFPACTTYTDTSGAFSLNIAASSIRYGVSRNINEKGISWNKQSGTFNFIGYSGKKIKFDLIDVSGKSILSEQINNAGKNYGLKINLRTGIYFAQIKTDYRNDVYKIVKLNSGNTIISRVSSSLSKKSIISVASEADADTTYDLVFEKDSYDTVKVGIPRSTITYTYNVLLAKEQSVNDSLLYGLHWDNAALTEYFVSVAPTTGSYNIISSIPRVKWITLSSSSIDETHRRYIFAGSDNNSNTYLYSINMADGTVVSSPSYPSVPSVYKTVVYADSSTNDTISTLTSAGNFIELRYDKKSDSLYGLHWDNTDSTEYFVSVAPTTGSYNIISSIPGVKWITLSSSSIDETHRRYIFAGSDNNSNTYLYSINMTDGTVVSSPSYPSASTSGSNFIELRHF
jgi:hypothetical protein